MARWLRATPSIRKVSWSTMTMYELTDENALSCHSRTCDHTGEPVHLRPQFLRAAAGGNAGAVASAAAAAKGALGASLAGSGY
ncbi:hypothetical protein EVAR_48839_1 [Eumeta japonica]|uniref:Uncharacterized protein n=1 Tax=Eumeta variegata TaxID=151549 RepID=A0A4C1YEU4_EUMVA|nr:hypothetical protein EVAR_48839_1 [Eumeta japonica]